MRRLRHVMLTLALVVGTLTLPAPATAASFDVCPVGCQFTAIGDAVALAQPGDVVTIGPGIYLETVVVDKPLTLLGTHAGIHATEHSGTESLVVPLGASAFDVQSAGVTLDGFHIQSSGGSDKVGIVGGSQMQVLNTRFAGNTAALIGFGEQVEVSGNVFEENNLDGLLKEAVVATDAPAGGILVVNNVFIGNDAAALRLGSGPHAGAVVAFNRLENTGGLVLSNASDVFLWGNRLAGTPGDGIVLDGGVAGAYARENVVERAGGVAFRVALAPGHAPSERLALEKNRLTESAVGLEVGDGALLDVATIAGNALRDNLVQVIDPDGRLGLESSMAANLVSPAVLLQHGDGSATTLVHTEVAPVLATAVAGDVLVLSAGEFNESITLTERIGIRGAGSGDDPSHDTILRTPNASEPALTLLAGGDSPTERLVVQGVRFTGGHGPSADTASGIRIGAGIAHVTLDDVASVGNEGHGLAIDTTGELFDLVLSNATLNDNAQAGLSVPRSVSRLENLTLVDSDVSGNVLNGILLIADGDDVTNVTIERTSVSANAIDQPISQGRGGITLYDFNGRAVLREVSVYVTRADFGVQIVGIENGPAPDILLERNAIGGDPVRNALVLQNYDDASGIVLRHNAFSVGAKAALTLYDFGPATSVDARHNYWGAPTGPVYDPFRMVPDAPVRGGAIVAYPEQVAFAPWCVLPNCTDANVVEPLTRDLYVTLPPLRMPEGLAP